MILTSRIKEIITILLDQREYITIQVISDLLNVSKRTIVRELFQVDKCLEEKNITLEKKKGIGLKLNIEGHSIDEIRDWLKSEVTDLIYSPEQRQTMLKAELLKEAELTKVFSLTHLLDVTESTIRNDLDQIQEWFEKFDLELIRKPGLGVYILGSEKSMRMAIVALLYEHFHEIDFINFIINNKLAIPIPLEFSKTKIDILVFSLIESSYIQEIRELLKELEITIGYQFADHSYIALIIRYLVTIKRVLQGLVIHIDGPLKEQLRHDKVYLVLCRWTDQHTNAVIHQLHEDELFYLVMHIKGAKLSESISENRMSMIEELKMVKIAKKIIKVAEMLTNTYLEDDEKLLNGLVRHLGPAINRIKLELDVMNPLVKEIRAMYPSLYQVALECVKVIEEEEKIVVLEDEVAYIATHIGSAIKHQKTRASLRYRVVIACGSGIGTSQLLATEIEKEFQNIHIVDFISALDIDVGKINDLNVDLMITTIPIPEIDFPTIHVNCILTELDKVQIKDFLEGVIPKPYLAKNFIRIDFIEKLIRFKQYCDILAEVANNFRLIEDVVFNDFKELIHFVSALIVSPDSSRKELEKAFMEREEKGSTILGKKSMMLLHTRSSVVEQLYFMIIRGKDKIPIFNDKKVLVYLDVIVVMVAPIAIKSIELEVLSEITRKIITSQFADLLKMGSKHEIYLELSEILDLFLQSKVIVTE